jgi:hypothetical protein
VGLGPHKMRASGCPDNTHATAIPMQTYCLRATFCVLGGGGLWTFLPRLRDCELGETFYSSKASLLGPSISQFRIGGPTKICNRA